MTAMMLGIESRTGLGEELFTGLNLKVQGHLRILEYKTYQDYQEKNPHQVLLNRRNAIHKDNIAIMAVKAITNREAGQIAYMYFGNGGTNLDNTGTVTFKAPNVGSNSDLYSPVYFQLVDDTTGALSGNQMNVRHITNTLFSDVDIRCVIGANQPFGQIGFNTLPTITNPTTILNLGTEHFAFDEIGLKLADGTLVTHVIFVPIVKSAATLLEVIYTIRVAIQGALPLPPIPMQPKRISLIGQQATAQVGTFGYNYRVQSLRFNDSPYLAKIPKTISLADSPVGFLSVWVRGTDIFNVSHDSGPALISSANRRTMDISGRGYIRRNPSAITRANPCHVTISNHGLTTGDTIEFTNVVGGCSELQGQTPIVTVIDANNFSVPIDSSAFSAAYTGPAEVTFINQSQSKNNNALRIVFRSDDNPSNSSASIFYWNSAEQIPLDQWVNLLISWDMNHTAGTKVLQVYVNDTALSSASDPTYRYDPNGAFTVQYTSTPNWVIGTPVVVPTYVNTGQIVREVLRSRN